MDRFIRSQHNQQPTNPYDQSTMLSETPCSYTSSPLGAYCGGHHRVVGGCASRSGSMDEEGSNLSPQRDLPSVLVGCGDRRRSEDDCHHHHHHCHHVNAESDLDSGKSTTITFPYPFRRQNSIGINAYNFQSNDQSSRIIGSPSGVGERLLPMGHAGLIGITFRIFCLLSDYWL